MILRRRTATSVTIVTFRQFSNVGRRLVVLLIGTLGVCLAQTGAHADASAPEAGLVGYWNFDEPSGASVFDASGSNNVGTVSGSGVTRVGGKVGPGALNFDGVSGKVTIPNSSTLNFTSSFTLTAWVRPTSFNSYQTILFKGTTSACTYWLQTTSNHFSSGFATSPNCSQYREHVVTSTTPQSNTWYHVAAVFDNAANSFKYYVNGIVVYSASEMAAPASTTESLVIGQSTYAGGSNERWRGQVDEIRAYNRALSAQEVLNVFNDTGVDYGEGGTTSDRNAPSVQLTDPASNAVLEGSVALSASASDDVGVVAAQFLLDGAAIGAEDTSAPYSVTWNTAQTSDGSHQVAVRARDAAGNVAVSAPVTVRVDNLPPTGTIAINSGGNYTSSRTVTLNLSANDGAGSAITEMRFSNGWTYSSPETFRTTKTWTLSYGEGLKTVSVQYRDSTGHWSQGFTDSITYDYTAPTISAVTPSSVSSSSAALTWTTNEASTSRVDYGPSTAYGQTSQLFAALVTSHSVTLSGLQPNTTYNYRVRSTDAAGNESVSSNSTFRTTNTTDTSAPNVAIQEPADNVRVAGIVTISATASDNRGVTGVQFLLDNVALGAEDTAAPYALQWDTAGVTGTHTLLARARDAAGNTGTSAPIRVTVDRLSDNQPPTVPTSVSATAVSSSQIDLSWGSSTDDVGPVSYQIFRGGNQIATSTTTSFSDVGLAPSSTYVYAVRAIDGAGNMSLQSTSVSAQTEAPDGSGSSVFPLRLSSDRTYLVDQNNRPFFINGDTAWSLAVNTTKSEATEYLRNRADKGYNAIIVNLIDTVFSDKGPRNLAGDAPFTTANNFATPGAAYWSHVDWVINEAAANNIVVFAHPLYLGFQCGVEGWCQAVKNASTTTMRAYGEFLGQRYRNQPNIVWVIGGDANPVAEGVESKVMAMVNGIRAQDTVHLMTAHNIQESAINPRWANDSWIDLNTVYTYGEAHQATLNEYNRDPRPIFLQETSYERDGTPESQTRRQAWWAVLSGARLGHFFGNCPLWGFDQVRSYCTAPSGGWQGQLNSTLSIQLSYVGRLFSSRAVHLFVPDQQGSVMTAGVQSGSSKATTARAKDGSTVIAYIPSRRQVTMDMSKVSGTQAHGWWFNPRTATATDLGTFATSGTRSFTPPDTNDWVLVLDNASLNLGAPGTN